MKLETVNALAQLIAAIGVIVSLFLSRRPDSAKHPVTALHRG